MSREVEFDDGRVEQVETERKATDRYGRSAEGERKAERENGYVEFEGEAENRFGREVDYAGVRGPRGGAAVVNPEYGPTQGIAYRTAPYGRGVYHALPVGHVHVPLEGIAVCGAGCDL